VRSLVIWDHIGSVTCHPTEVILTPLPPAYCRYSFIDPRKGWKAELT